MKTTHRLALAALLPLALLLTAAAPGCLSNTPGDPNPDHSIDWPSYVECGPDVSDLIGVVTRIVMSNDGFAQGKELADNAVAELEALAKEHGGETVACLVDRLIADWSRPGAAASEQIGPALERAKSFMRSEGIEVRRDGYGPEASLRTAPIGIAGVGNRPECMASWPDLAWRGPRILPVAACGDTTL